MERSMLGITRKDKKPNEWIIKKTGVEDILEKIDTMKWSWAGHVGRMDNDRWAKKSTEMGHQRQKEIEGDQQEDGGMISKKLHV